MADDKKGVPTLATELWELVVAYAKQETIVPVKRLGRFIGLGVAGSFVLGIGLTMLTLAALRALQTETGSMFRGNWSWAPYTITLLACGVVAAFAARAIGSEKRKGN